MSDPFLGELRPFAGTFAPVGWALCDGQRLQISQHDALFSLIGTTYGGNGVTDFALPDLRGRLPMGYGDGAGLTPRLIGTRTGTDAVTLTEAQMPSHNHRVRGASTAGSTTSPAGAVPARGLAYRASPDSSTRMGAVVVPTGRGLPHENLQPALALNWIIALSGIYPSQS